MDRPYLIKDRLEFINNMTEKKHIDSMIDSSSDIKKKLHNFRDLIIQIGGKLSFVKSGSSGYTFKGEIKKEGHKINYAVKIVAYPKREKYGNPDNEQRPENAELKMIKVLSQFVIDQRTPHIVLPIYSFNADLKNIIDILNRKTFIHNKKYKDKFDQFVKTHQEGGYHKNASILISEWADGGDFLDFLKKHYKKMKLKHWKVFFFQIISTLAVILDEYPKFRHNDLKPNNILIQKTKKPTGTSEWYSYKINNNFFKIPNIGYQIKLWDFDFACIPDVVGNSKVTAQWTSKINVNPTRNQYYDVHYFFNTLTTKGFIPEILTDKEVDQEVKDFILRVVPPKLSRGKHVTKRGRLLIDQEFLTPDKIIKTDPFFQEFRLSQTQSNKI